ncbi:hypothetical protein DFR50_14255 [Roseiarcus fermentans]|uniref:Tail tube GTA-gp10-like protein n=1 Tax=Roseiarcus fermentans TaxID=1473586 RepID=A0A366EN03_9HYPH|nr:hypothetical protein [Roseiarcus fermentans]RBP03807.1 hypothetical protein DFR50_14255 [Roseiarcus fermentans]
MPNTIALGGKTWTLPALPWRIVREVQPEIGKFFALAGDGGTNTLRLTTAELDALAGVVFRAAGHVDRTLTREAFDDLAFSPLDVVRAIPAVARACGLVKESAAAPDPLDARPPAPDE